MCVYALVVGDFDVTFFTKFIFIWMNIHMSF